MKYQVIWTRHAEGELAQIWLDAIDRNAIANSARQIDAALARDPLSCGESRAHDKRIFFAGPLVVEFRTSDPDAQVHILSVRKYGKA
jgi:plasmid stabilization system protein ParE